MSDDDDNNNTMNTQSPLFEGQSTDRPTLLSISFASDPSASLGVSLSSHDNNLTNEMFLPGYASIGAIPTDEITNQNTLAQKFGVRVGDYIVEVNGEGFRRFPPDFPEEELEQLGSLTLEEDDPHVDLINLASIEEDDDEHDNITNDDDKVVENGIQQEQDDYSYQPQPSSTTTQQLKSRVLHPNPTTPNQNYNSLLTKIRQIKSLRSPTTPLQLTLERYQWDSRVHSWSRFLSARRGNVPQAMTMIMAHERWRLDFFPIDLTEGRLQEVFRSCAVSEVDIVANNHATTNNNSGSGSNGGGNKPAVVYIDLAKLQMMMTGGIDLSTEVVQAFVVHTETLLNRSPDPRSPKTSQMVDLTGVNLKQGLKVNNMLKKLYRVFEPNYPETLERMVMYPVPKALVSVVNAMLSFVNVHTRKKIVITDDLVVVCKELGWNLKEIEEEGGVRNYMRKHLMQNGRSFVFD